MATLLDGETGQIGIVRNRRNRPRPELPGFNWMVCPNTIAYALSWYGLFVGKFPCQVLCFSFGLCAFFAAGIYRIQVSDLKPEDYLPTDSRSNVEREISLQYDIKKHVDEWTSPMVHFRAIEGGLGPPQQQNTNATRQGRSLPKSTSFNVNKKREKWKRAKLALPKFLTELDDFNGEDDSWQKVSVLPWSNRVRIERRQTFRDHRPFRNQNCRSNSVLIIARKNSTDPEGRRYNLLTNLILGEIRRLERHIFGIWVKAADGKRYYYENSVNRTGICTRGRGGGCSGFNLRTMSSFVLTAREDPLHLLLSPDSAVALTYPNYFLLDLTPFLGGVRTRNNEHNGFVERVEAIREVFCINEYQSDQALHDAAVWLQWEDRFDTVIRRFRSPYVDVYWITEKQKHSEQNALINDMLPKVCVTFLALMLWCTVGAVGHDAVRSKPWAGFIGVFATMTATCAGFGFCLWRDSKFSPVLMAVPLLTLAIGLDDMFIILEAWSRTPSTQPVEERMMLAMRQGGTSIFITFIINLLDFVIGNYTPYPIINYLSQTATVTILFDFFCQMTIFCASLTLFGKNEPKNRHSCLCCLRVPVWNHQKISNTDPLSDDENQFGKVFRLVLNFFRLTCCSNISKLDHLEPAVLYQPVSESTLTKENVEEISMEPLNTTNNENQPSGDFLEPPEPMVRNQPIVDFVSRHLFSNHGRLVTICGFIVYVALSSWSISYLNIGLKPERVFRQNSNLYDYMYQQRQWFSDYTPEVVVIVNREVDYSKPEIRARLLEYETHVEESGLFWGPDETSFWLRDYLKWHREVVQPGNVSTCCQNVSQILADFQYYPDGFLMTEPYGKHSRDLRIDVNATRILKSRIRFRAKQANTPDRQIKMMQTIRSISDAYTNEFDFSVYSSDFLLYDQFLTAVPATLYYSGITLAVTIAVALFMVPHLFCVIWVGISVVSILGGVIGAMRCWDMDLDSVTLINLLIAITLSADFVTHAAYIFLNASPINGAKLEAVTLKSSQIRIFKAHALISEVAQAAILASIGTILSVLAMSNSDAYIFVTFFRILFLTIVLSLLHALIFLPVFLSLFGPVGTGNVPKRHSNNSSKIRKSNILNYNTSDDSSDERSSLTYRRPDSAQEIINNQNDKNEEKLVKIGDQKEDAISTCSEPPTYYDNGAILDTIFLQQSQQSQSIEFFPLACSTRERNRRNTIAILDDRKGQQDLDYFGAVSTNPVMGGVGRSNCSRFPKPRASHGRRRLSLFLYGRKKAKTNQPPVVTFDNEIFA